MVILDLGCGLGSITVGLISRLPNGEVNGLDTSSDPFAEGLKLAADREVRNNSSDVGNTKRLCSPDNTRHFSTSTNPMLWLERNHHQELNPPAKAWSEPYSNEDAIVHDEVLYQVEPPK